MTNPVDGGSGLVWTYTYEGDRLAAACPPPEGVGPQTACSRYEYQSSSQYRSVVLDTNPRSYWRLGDAASTVAASQSVVQGGKDNGTHRNVTAVAQGALGGTPDGAAHFNGTNAYVDLPKDLVRANPYLSVELWFRTTAGGTLFSYSQKPVEEQDGSTPGVPVLYVGSDGKLRGQFWNGQFDPIASTGAVNDGQWHHVVLSGQGTTQTLYLDNSAVGSRAGEIENLDPVNTIGAGGSHDSWPSRWRFTYTPAGQLAETILLGWTGDPWGMPPRDLVLESRAYDPAGRLASVTDSMGGTTEFQYYDDDKLAKTVARYVQDGQGVKHDLVLERNWYDGAGNVVRTTTGNGTQTTEFKRDSLGRVVESILDPGGLHRVTTHTYNAAGDRTQSLRTGPDITRPEVVDVEYDAFGRPLKETVRNDDGTGRVDTDLVTTVTYDQRGLVTSTKSPNANAAACTGVCEVSMTYDILGRLVRTDYDGLGRPVRTTPNSGRATSMTYSPAGRVDQVDNYDHYGGVIRTATQKYDHDGKVTRVDTPAGGQTSYTYDRGGRLTTQVEKVSATESITTSFEYDAAGSIVENSRNAPAPNCVTKPVPAQPADGGT